MQGRQEELGRQGPTRSRLLFSHLYSLPPRRVFVSCNEPDYRKGGNLPLSSTGLVRRARGNHTPAARYGGDVAEASAGAGRRAPPPRVRGRRRRPQRRVRPVRGHDGAARRRVHPRRGLRGPRRLLLRRRAALPLRQPPRARQQPRAGRALPPPGRRDFAPHRQLLLLRPGEFLAAAVLPTKSV